jgi:hypothetical protein
MEILWPALGICILVVFVFFVLAQHWQRVLRQHSWTIRKLTDRVRMLEEVDDPEFRRKLSESAPSPLEQVLTFSFRLSDRFWRETLHTTDEDAAFIKSFGSFLGSVKIERWRAHSVATVTEVLPERQSAAWQTRSLDCSFDGQTGCERLTLWELPLARVRGSSVRPPSLELVLKEKSLELCGHFFPPAAGNGHSRSLAEDELVFFRVPFDSAQLAEFRSPDPLEEAGNGNGSSGSGEISLDRNFWRAFYSQRDDKVGFEWQLWLRDLSKKSEWDRWKILEPVVAPFDENAAHNAR